MVHNMELIAMASTGSVVVGLLNVAKVEENIKRLTIEKSNFEKEITKTSKVIEKAVELKNKEQALNDEYQKATKQLELLNKKYVQ